MLLHVPSYIIYKLYTYNTHVHNSIIYMIIPATAHLLPSNQSLVRTELHVSKRASALSAALRVENSDAKLKCM